MSIRRFTNPFSSTNYRGNSETTGLLDGATSYVQSKESDRVHCYHVPVDQNNSVYLPAPLSKLLRSKNYVVDGIENRLKIFCEHDLVRETEFLRRSTYISTAISLDMFPVNDLLGKDILALFTRPRHLRLTDNHSPAAEVQNGTLLTEEMTQELADLLRQALIMYELRNCTVPTRSFVSMSRKTLETAKRKNYTVYKQSNNATTYKYEASCDVNNTKPYAYRCVDPVRGIAALKYLLYPFSTYRKEAPLLQHDSSDEWKQFLVITDHYTLLISRSFASISRMTSFFKSQLGFYLSSTVCAKTPCPLRRSSVEVNHCLCKSNELHCLHQCSLHSSLLPVYDELGEETKEFLLDNSVCFHTQANVLNLARFLISDFVNIDYAAYKPRSTFNRFWKTLPKKTNSRITSPQPKIVSGSSPTQAKQTLEVLYILGNSFFLHANQTSWVRNRVEVQSSVRSNRKGAVQRIVYHDPVLPSSMALIFKAVYLLTSWNLLRRIDINTSYSDPPPNSRTCVAMELQRLVASEEQKPPEQLACSDWLYHNLIDFQPYSAANIEMNKKVYATRGYVWPPLLYSIDFDDTPLAITSQGEENVILHEASEQKQVPLCMDRPQLSSEELENRVQNVLAGKSRSYDTILQQAALLKNEPTDHFEAHRTALMLPPIEALSQPDKETSTTSLQLVSFTVKQPPKKRKKR